MYTRSEMKMAGWFQAWVNMRDGGCYWQFVCATDYLNGRR